jgi:hypothetical protein
MATYTVTVNDTVTLERLAELHWRDSPDKEACALLEQVLNKEHARLVTAGLMAADKTTGSKRGRRPNGVAALA